jgi:hypothetical protein
MFDRQFIGDIGLAILLALPTAFLARPVPVAQPGHAYSPLVQQAVVADRSPTRARISLLG